MNSLTVSIKNQVQGDINYGFGAKKLTVRVTDGDGPTLVFALICLFRPCVGVEEDIETLFYQAYKAFKNVNNPMEVISELRAPLVEATELHTEFKWSQSGAKIVEVLCHNDHNMSEALEDFKELTPPDSTVTALLQNLFAAISRQCTKEVHYVDGNKRSANAASIMDRIGLKEDGSPAKRRRQDGEPHYDSSNKTGGKCEGAGCPADKQTKRLCTTCFHKLLDDGTIKTKAGGEIEKGHLCRPKGKGGKGKGKGKGKGSKGKS